MNLQPQPPLRASSLHHLIDLSDWDGDRIRKLLKEAIRLKKAHAAGRSKPLLQGRVLGLIFEKPSLRTRVSFQAGMAQLGGEAIFLTHSDSGLGKRESLPDIARTLSQFVDAVVLRTYRHETVEEFARWSSCPVINGLSDYAHPCQALGDLLTLSEAFDGKLTGRTVVFVGDGNNVARSLALACGKVGVQFVLSAPAGYGFDGRFLDMYRAEFSAEPVLEPDPQRAVAGADVIYTDVWASMGQEDRGGRAPPLFRRLPGQRRAVEPRAGARAGDALSARPPRRGDHRQRARRSAQRRVRAGRQPHARAEGAVAVGDGVGDPMSEQPRLLITMGDVAGIGPEIIARAWPDLQAVCRPIVVGDPVWLQRAIELVGSAAHLVPVQRTDERAPLGAAHPLPRGQRAGPARRAARRGLCARRAVRHTIFSARPSTSPWPGTLTASSPRPCTRKACTPPGSTIPAIPKSSRSAPGTRASG